MRQLTVTSRNAQFQQWQALLTNRTKRQRSGEFLVHGVRPITLAIEYSWDIRAVICPTTGVRSRWATQIFADVNADHVAMAPDLLRELADKDDEPELLAVVGMRPDDLSRIPVRHQQLTVVFDRPVSPGNLGTVIRSADSFAADGVVVTGHAADIYDPKAVRASTGSLFTVPTIRARGPDDLRDWARTHAAQIIGTDESGTFDIDSCDFTGPTMLVVGNETTGMSNAWRDACDVVGRIPIAGAASSLNAATAAAVALYEAARQRRTAAPLTRDRQPPAA